jgi:peptidoglycan hydrolase-like protein with peptidoglycan-binding domain
MTDAPTPNESPKPAPTSLNVVPASKSDGESVVTPKPVPAPPKPVAVVSSIGSVDVVVGSLVYQARALRSISVAVVQDRLTELGYGDARGDLRGWLSDGTVKALTAFQSSSGLLATGIPDMGTVKALLKDTGATVTD